MDEKVSNDGGPAFPGEQGQTPDGNWNQTWEHGMSLRDYFAGQVIAGIYASKKPYSCCVYDEDATTAYIQASAMLKARQRDDGDDSRGSVINSPGEVTITKSGTYIITIPEEDKA